MGLGLVSGRVWVGGVAQLASARSRVGWGGVGLGLAKRLWLVYG